MIEKALKTIKGKIAITIPTTLDEVTLGQLMALQDAPELDDLTAISILSGTPLATLQNVVSTHELLAFATPVLSLAQQLQYLYDSDDIPKKVSFLLPGNKALTINVMQNLALEPAGAFMACREIIADEINDHIKNFPEDSAMELFKPSLKACCQVLANYFYCRVTRMPYNEYEVEPFCDEIKKLRVTEALPIAKHFFYCYPNFSKPKTGYWFRILRHWKKRPGYNVLKNSNI